MSSSDLAIGLIGLRLSCHSCHYVSLSFTQAVIVSLAQLSLLLSNSQPELLSEPHYHKCLLCDYPAGCFSLSGSLEVNLSVMLLGCHFNKVG